MVNGETLPVDSYRTFEQPSLGGNVKDFSAEVLSKALNSNAIHRPLQRLTLAFGRSTWSAARR